MGSAGGGDRQQQQQQHDGGNSDADLYGVLGLSRECTDADLRLAYRKLAMIWHPDRRSAAGGSATAAVEAKERFQEIQGAYSVLSDSNKRFLYDVGVYDGDDDEADLLGMGDFLGEMAQMMSQVTPTESFEELQQVFVDMFQDDIDAGFCQIPGSCAFRSPPSCPTPSSSPSPATTNAQKPAASRKGVNKRCSSQAMDSSFGLGISGFCFEAPWTSPDTSTGGGGKRRKQRSPVSRNV